MKKKLFLLVIMSAIIILAVSNTVKANDIKKENDRGILSTRGTVSENFSPDTAIIILGVETQAKTATEAANLNSKKARNVVDKINSMIDKKQGDFIKTSRYSINPVYEYTKDQRKSILTGYKATNQVTITTKQLNIVSGIIDSAIASGANNVQGIDFTIDNKEGYCKKVLEKATLNALEEAKIITKTLNVNIVGIKQVSSSCGSEFPSPVFKTMQAGLAGMESYEPSTPIEAGEIKIQGNVNIDFYIK